MQHFRSRNHASYSARRRVKSWFGDKTILTKIYRGLPQSLQANVEVKVKAILVQAWTGPEGSRRFRLRDFKTIST
jgi:hypothetical protein